MFGLHDILHGVMLGQAGVAPTSKWRDIDARDNLRLLLGFLLCLLTKDLRPGVRRLLTVRNFRGFAKRYSGVKSAANGWAVYRTAGAIEAGALNLAHFFPLILYIIIYAGAFFVSGRGCAEHPDCLLAPGGELWSFCCHPKVCTCATTGTDEITRRSWENPAGVAHVGCTKSTCATESCSRGCCSFLYTRTLSKQICMFTRREIARRGPRYPSSPSFCPQIGVGEASGEARGQSSSSAIERPPSISSLLQKNGKSLGEAIPLSVIFIIYTLLLGQETPFCGVASRVPSVQGLGSFSWPRARSESLPRVTPWMAVSLLCPCSWPPAEA